MSLINFFTEFFREYRQEEAARGASDSENMFGPFNLLIFIFFKFVEKDKFSVNSSFNKEPHVFFFRQPRRFCQTTKLWTFERLLQQLPKFEMIIKMICGAC